MRVISVYSPTFDQHDSYGIVAESLALGLEARGFFVNRISNDLDQKQPIVPTLGGFVLGYPTRIPELGGMASSGPMVCITMFESTQLPSGWVENLNRCRATIVTSTWLVDLFKNSGVTTPVTCSHLGLDPAYSYKPRVEQTPMTFLTIGDRGARKGWHLAGGAFVNAFGDDPNYRLIIKTRANYLPIQLSNPNVVVYQEDLTVTEMAELYQRCDCMVFPTKGEGFGLPPREFAATGGISIATAWGGTADHLEMWGLPIEYTMESAWDGFFKFKDLGEWARPDLDHITETLKFVAGLSLEDRNRMGAEFSKNVKELYNWNRFVDDCLEVWEREAVGNGT